MPLTKREAFKVAFLCRCADLGLTMDESHVLIKRAIGGLAEKQAQTVGGGTQAAGKGVWPTVRENIPGLTLTSDLARSAAKGVFGTLLPKLMNLGILGAIGIPIAAGGGIGYGLAKLQGINDPEPDEIKAQEKRDFYHRAAQRARKRKEIQERITRTKGRRSTRLLI